MREDLCTYVRVTANGSPSGTATTTIVTYSSFIVVDDSDQVYMEISSKVRRLV